MREFWANVRVRDGVADVGNPRATRELARKAVDLSPRAPAFRIHVRLKPEGAPRRYRDDYERWAWETAAHYGTTPRYA